VSSRRKYGLVETRKTQSGASAETNIIRQRYLGELQDHIREGILEDVGHFCHTDFALKLRKAHRVITPAPVMRAWHLEIAPAAYRLELFVVRGGATA